MNDSIKILGAYGAKSFELNTTCIQLNNEIVIDAGNILKSLGDDAHLIKHIFLTHSHLDHIVDIPLLVDSYFEKFQEPITIYGIKKTLDDLKEHLFNNRIWPDFSKIKLSNESNNAIVFKEIAYGQTIEFEDVSLKVIANNHTSSSCGFVIKKKSKSLLFTSDTYLCQSIWNEINEDPEIKSVIVDVSFPSRFEWLAKESKHLTPKLLHEELKQLKRNDVTVFVNHLKPIYLGEIKHELKEYNALYNNGMVLQDLDTLNLETATVIHSFDSERKQIKYLNKIGYALTSEKNIDVLMDKILDAAKTLTNADAGTIYLMNDDDRSLSFKIVHTDSMHLKMGGTGEKINWPDLQLYNEDDSENKSMIAVKCALEKVLINIDDVYKTEKFDFSGPKNFDSITNYKTQSMLVAPLVNNDNDVIGVLQLINKKDKNNQSMEFTHEDEKLILSMGSQAAVSISNSKLIKDLENLLNSFIKVIATAIGEKSKYTVGHINRVADITLDIANAVNDDKTGIFKDKNYSAEELKVLDIAAWMHDIGKIATPEYVVDKATKLETIHDRIHLVQAKFEIVKRDLEIEYYKNAALLIDEKEKKILKTEFTKKVKELEEDLEFLVINNKGAEFMSDDKIERMERIAKKELIINNEKAHLLSEDELKNMCIKRGTLTEEERYVINEHADISIKMLESLPFPKKLKDVPTIAGAHHEKICGGGYPKNLKGDEISFESRILAIADIFEALTAHDRPYKEPNTLNQSLKILMFMAKDDHLDRELVKFFIENKVYENYMSFNLMPTQLDEVTCDTSIL